MLIDSYQPASRERQRVGRFLVVGASLLSALAIVAVVVLRLLGSSQLLWAKRPRW